MTILIVDDNEQNVYQLQIILSAHGYQVVTAVNGVDALAKARQTPPGLILSDILMPMMDGFTLCREWKKDELLRQIPFVFYTATYTDERDREFALSLGAERFLVKPEEPDVIIQTIREILRQGRDPSVAPRRTSADALVSAPSKAPPQEENDYLQQYNATLIRKLEAKMQQLEQANRKLEQGIVELKRTEKDLREMQDQMIRQERLSALGQMAAGIVHDFNNALMPIMANAEYFLVNPTLPDNSAALAQGLQEILRGAEDAKAIVNRLREFYRPSDETVFVPMKLDKTIQSAMDLTKPRWQKEMQTKGVKLDVRAEFPDTPVYVNGHEFELREALTNLILNAVDAMPGNGAITVRCRREDAHVIIEVSDTGTGMTPEVSKHCFEPFFSTKGAQGTGLGLSMVYGIVQRHNGTISVESKVGKGTTFRIMLPACKSPESEGAGSPPAAAPQLAPQRVMLIDDDIMALKVITRLLIMEGHHVKTAQDGQTGIQALQAEPFDMLITDRSLGGMSGDEVAKTVKGLYPDMPVILLTGFGGIMNIHGEKPPGVDVVLGKPALKEDVIEALRQALAAKAKYSAK